MFATSPIRANYRYNASLMPFEVYGYPSRQWMYDPNLLDIPVGLDVPGLGNDSSAKDHKVANTALVAAAGIVVVGLVLMISGGAVAKRAESRTHQSRLGTKRRRLVAY